jgi:hypothetical protein
MQSHLRLIRPDDEAIFLSWYIYEEGHVYKHGETVGDAKFFQTLEIIKRTTHKHSNAFTDDVREDTWKLSGLDLTQKCLTIGV